LNNIYKHLKSDYENNTGSSNGTVNRGLFRDSFGCLRLITSGTLLTDYFQSNHLTGARCVVLGPEDSVHYVVEAGGEVVSPLDSFEVLVLADEGGYPFLETLDTVLTALFRKLDRREKTHLILPNPDLIYPKSNQEFGIASGCVALMIEAALQLRYQASDKLRFKRLGKPHAAIFEQALKRSGTRDMIMVGDQLETDIRGASAFGIDSALVATGVVGRHTGDLCPHFQPTYLLATL
jgi:ribonucleotide monophosphatase NagD (HAD superfamily)